MSNDHPPEPGERCAWPDCGNTATHKVGEQAALFFHEMTTYLCCDHMRALSMNCADYPYATAMRDPFHDVRGAVEQIGLATLPALTETELKLLRRCLEGKVPTTEERPVVNSLFTAVSEAISSARRVRRGDDG